MGRTVAVAVEHFQPIAGPDRVESGLGVAQVPQIGTGLRFAADGSVASASLLLLLLLLLLLPLALLARGAVAAAAAVAARRRCSNLSRHIPRVSLHRFLHYWTVPSSDIILCIHKLRFIFTW